MDRIYTFKSGVKVKCLDDGYMSAEEIKTLESTGDELLSVKYGNQIVAADNRRKDSWMQQET